MLQLYIEQGDNATFDDICDGNKNCATKRYRESDNDIPKSAHISIHCRHYTLQMIKLVAQKYIFQGNMISMMEGDIFFYNYKE